MYRVEPINGNFEEVEIESMDSPSIKSLFSPQV
jgi:hypothetical protein